ncbi:MAG: hypothetical protein K6T57_00680 [Thermaceae bacterium]|nr:hypothetical protein [Thermaceae bacterium]
MLGDNLKALRTASALMNKATDAGEKFTQDDLQKARRAFALMIGRVEESQAKFAPGTPQHTLLQSRLRALRVAEALIRAELDRVSEQAKP